MSLYDFSCLFMSRVKSRASTTGVGKRQLPFRPVTVQHPRTPRAFWQHRAKPNVQAGPAAAPSGRDGAERSGAARQPRAALEPSPRPAPPRPTPQAAGSGTKGPKAGCGGHAALPPAPESSRRPATPPAAWAGGSARLGRPILHLTSAPPLCPLARRGKWRLPAPPRRRLAGAGRRPMTSALPSRTWRKAWDSP